MEENVESSDLFNKLKIGINKGLRIVNVRSKEAYVTLKYKNDIQGKNRYKKKLIEELGNTVFRTFKHKGSLNEDGIKSKCASIVEVETEIEDMHEQIRLVHENAQKELGKLKAITKPESAPKCSECGAEIAEGSDTCPVCGKKALSGDNKGGT